MPQKMVMVVMIAMMVKVVVMGKVIAGAEAATK